MNVTIKGQWKDDEDNRLRDAVEQYSDAKGVINWKSVSQYVGTRSREKCRSHWEEVLSPLVNRTCSLPALP